MGDLNRDRALVVIASIVKDTTWLVSRQCELWESAMDTCDTVPFPLNIDSTYSSLHRDLKSVTEAICPSLASAFPVILPAHASPSSY